MVIYYLCLCKLHMMGCLQSVFRKGRGVHTPYLQGLSMFCQSMLQGVSHLANVLPGTSITWHTVHHAFALFHGHQVLWSTSMCRRVLRGQKATRLFSEERICLIASVVLGLWSFLSSPHLLGCEYLRTKLGGYPFCSRAFITFFSSSAHFIPDDDNALALVVKVLTTDTLCTTGWCE